MSSYSSVAVAAGNLTLSGLNGGMGGMGGMGGTGGAGGTGSTGAPGPACQTLPGVCAVSQPPSRIFVQRWNLVWSNAGALCGDGAPCWMQLAKCSWVEGRYCLPAKPDWPRWRTSPGGLPPDQYWRVSYHAQYSAPAVTDGSVGPVLTWVPMFEPIDTPRSYRWCACLDGCVCDGCSSCGQGPA